MGKRFFLLTIFFFNFLNSQDFNRNLIEQHKTEISKIVFKNNVLRKLTYAVALPFLAKICYESFTGKQVFENKLRVFEIFNNFQTKFSSGIPFLIFVEVMAKFIRDTFIERDIIWITKETQIFEVIERFHANISAIRNSPEKHLQSHINFMENLFEYLKQNSAKIIAFIEYKAEEYNDNQAVSYGLKKYTQTLFEQLSGTEGYIVKIGDQIEKLKNNPESFQANLDNLQKLMINLSTCFDAIKFNI